MLKTLQRTMSLSLQKSLQDMGKGSEDSHATQTEAEEVNQLRLSTMKKLLNIRELSMKKTTPVEEEYAESNEEIRSWVKNNIS